MEQLTLEPLCEKQKHIFRLRVGHDNCEICYRKYTDYRCKNCYRELCNRCHTDEIIRIRDRELGITRTILIENIREQDIQMHKKVIGRRITRSPPSGLKSVFGFFKS